MQREKFYLTKQGLEDIKKRKEELQKAKSLKIKNETPDVLHSEELNPEYLLFLESMEFLEAEIAYLEDVLKKAVLIKSPPEKEQNKVCLGATVLLEVDGKIDELTIVGTLEANPSVGRISDECPVGKALLGGKVGEEIVVSSPVKITYKIKKIKYDF